MKLTLKYHPKLSEQQLAIIEELSNHTTKLYNIANYECREQEYASYPTLEKKLKVNWHRKYLHSHTYQQCLKVLEQNWTSYFKAVEDYQKNPSKYYGKPQPPKYKNTNQRKNEIIFTNFAIRCKGNHISLSLSKEMQHQFQVDSLKVEASEKLPLPEQAKIQQIRLQYDRVQKSWTFLIIYQQEPMKSVESSNIMAIDLGLENLATITFSHSEKAYIICGRTLKSKNSYYHQKIAIYQSIRMKQIGSERFKNTKRIRILRKKRHDYVQNCLHQTSRYILKLAREHDVGTIVIGDIQGMKQRNPLKSFVQIPIRKLVEMIIYKAELDGRTVSLQNESYTSGVSAYDLEPITKASYNNTRRIQRGLFRTERGWVVNADVNGSLNILRKVMKEGIPYPIQTVRDNGCVNHPRRIRVA
jgi:putative transposase